MLKNTKEKSVIMYMKKFLDSPLSQIMESCYSSIRDEVNNRTFRASINVLKDAEFDSFFPLVSMVILTANKIECDSLNYILSKQDDKRLSRRRNVLPIFEQSDIGAPEAYLFKMDSSYILHLNAYETGANTPGGSTDLTRYVSNHPFLRPSSIVSFGVCYGRDTITQNIGDVIIPKKLYPWSIGQKITDKEFVIKHDDFNMWLEDKFSYSGIYSSLRTFCNGEDGRIIKECFEINQCKHDFAIKVSFGNMSTGEAVVSSAKVKEMIQRSSRNEKELGGEMEGYGLAKESFFYSKTPCFIIKAICDWGEDKDIDKALQRESIPCPNNLKDKLQAYASFCAGLVLIQLLNQEKDQLLIMDLILWLGDKKRKNRLNVYNYADKEIIINNIRNYYKTSNDVANDIFDRLVSNEIVVQNRYKNQYHINPSLFTNH